MSLLWCNLKYVEHVSSSCRVVRENKQVFVCGSVGGVCLVFLAVCCACVECVVQVMCIHDSVSVCNFFISLSLRDRLLVLVCVVISGLLE